MKNHSQTSPQKKSLSVKFHEYDSLSFFSVLSEDVKRYKGWKNALIYYGFWIVLLYRLSHCLHKNHLDYLAIIIQFVTKIITGCDISRKAVIGPKLSIFHPQSIFVGPYVKMGQSCTIGPNCFIGSSKSAADPDDYPVIDDKVFISSGAQILGCITIGEKTHIGPNAVVMKDVPANSIVAPPTSRIFSKEKFHDFSQNQ